MDSIQPIQFSETQDSVKLTTRFYEYDSCQKQRSGGLNKLR
jgi:hypothetical protein